MTPSELRSDEDIVTAVRAGDAAQFGELMKRYEPKLSRYGRRFLGDSDAIDDAVQESFIRAYRNLKGFDIHQRFSPWMYRIAHNVFVNALRAKSRSPVFSVDLDTLIPHAAYEDPHERERSQNEMREAIDQGLAKVPPHYREVLVLYYLEELSYNDIAEVLRIPAGTVGVRLRRARRELGKHLDPSLLT